MSDSTLKLGIISDIHAALDSLLGAEACLREHGADRIICAGDLVDRGQNGDEVVQYIREAQWLCVQGNHDSQARETQAWMRKSLDLDDPMVGRFLLLDETLEFLASLPVHATLEVAGAHILLAHANPWNQHQYILPKLPPVVFRFMAEQVEADYVILGHTHQPMHVKVGNHAESLTVLNPGSVIGPGYVGSHTCAMLSLPDGAYTVFDIQTQQPVEIVERVVV